MKVFLDTNVLFDYLQCDMFLTVAETKWMDLDVFWSDYVLAELREHLADRMTETDPDHDRRQSELLVDKRIRAMGKAFPHATITGWERKLSAARCFVHDSDDAPILAATLQAGCRYLVTSNLKDFAIDELKSALNVSVLNTGMMFSTSSTRGTVTGQNVRYVSCCPATGSRQPHSTSWRTGLRPRRKRRSLLRSFDTHPPHRKTSRIGMEARSPATPGDGSPANPATTGTSNTERIRDA